MATLRQYFETDFSNDFRLHVTIQFRDEIIASALLYDFPAFANFIACYIPGAKRDLNDFVDFLEMLSYGTKSLQYTNQATLPSARHCPGLKLSILKNRDFDVEYQLPGEPNSKSMRAIPATRRVIIYSESDFDTAEIVRLQERAKLYGHQLLFRSDRYVKERSSLETPLAFISHDTRDKELIAKPIAIDLQRMLCPVWYDEYSLKVGDTLRESIQKGLKECKKCILIFSVMPLAQQSKW